MTACGVESVEQLEETWTPAQVAVMARAIQRQRALEAAERMEHMFIACAAAQGGREGFRGFRKAVDSLREEAGFEVPNRTARELARSLGLRR